VVWSRGCLLVAWAWHFSGDLLAVAVAVGCEAASVVVLLTLVGLAFAVEAMMMIKRPMIAIRADQTGWRRGQRRFAADRECRCGGPYCPPPDPGGWPGDIDIGVSLALRQPD